MELQWPLILFTSFLAASAGLFAMQGVYALRGKGGKTQLLALVVSLVLMVIGGIAVFMHLQHWERIFNGFGNPTSGITQELVAIVIMAVVMVLFFIFIRRSENDPEIPKWVSVLAILSALLLCIVMPHSYMMPSRPAWDSVFQIVSVVGAACGIGPALMAFLCHLEGENGKALPKWCARLLAKLRGAEAGEIDPGSEAAKAETACNNKAVWAGAIVNAVCTVAYMIFLCTIGSVFTQVEYYFDPVGPTRGINDVTAVNAFSADAMPYTISIIVAVVLSLVAAFMGKKSGNWKKWGWIVALLVFVVAILLRLLFYVLGVSLFSFFDV